MSKPASRVRLTAGRVQSFNCAEGKSQDFLWDCDAPSLALRASKTGRKTYVFESRLGGETIRLPIGTVADWPIEKARTEARRLKMLVDDGIDPRVKKKQDAEARDASKAREIAEAVTVGTAWDRYLAEGGPKRREAWKPRYAADMVKMAAPGGEPKKRGQGLTLPGPLAALMPLRLNAIDEDTLAAWFKAQSRRSKHQATRALMMFRGFLRWCSTQPEYRSLVDREAGRAPAILDTLPESTRRTDALEAAQVKAWWTCVEKLPNLTASAYLRGLLLTGARREELAGLRWDDVDFTWGKLTIADKVSDTRTIPLTDYMATMLARLPRVTTADGKINPHVFASTGRLGRVADPRSSHQKALKEAGIEGLTLHGLRRSFSLLGEAADAPAGAIAQVMGHRPSATAEGYRPRSIDVLRPQLQKIERHILALAGVSFDPIEASAERSHLRLVGGRAA